MCGATNGATNPSVSYGAMHPSAATGDTIDRHVGRCVA